MSCPLLVLGPGITAGSSSLYFTRLAVFFIFSNHIVPLEETLEKCSTILCKSRTICIFYDSGWQRVGVSGDGGGGWLQIAEVKRLQIPQKTEKKDQEGNSLS